jgi:hypothetical protein
MQTLGLGGPAERSDGRIKSLFWPSVNNDVDVDYLTTQGFWLCFIIATITLVVSFISGAYAGVLDALFFYLGGVGVRQRSKVAAACVFAVYVLGTISIMRVGYAGGGSGSVIRVFASALLLSNVRAVWIASNWRNSGREDESPVPLAAGIADKISDVMPARIWPWVRMVFYVFAVLEISGIVAVTFGLLPIQA